MPKPRTRLAPSPTGALHLGNARTFLINWALARRNGWGVVLRIEDLDGPRTKPGADRHAIDTLRWLGLDWEEGPLYQLADLSRYRAALDRLSSAGLVYPCRCTRGQIASAQSAPHGDEHELRYPGTCRADAVLRFEACGLDRRPQAPILEPQADLCLRFAAPDAPIRFADLFCGEHAINVQQSVGDFIVATKAGLPAYQLAVVVDDAAQGVTHVVRGDDLLRSTPRQALLYDALGLGSPPAYIHVPLVLGEDGRRLAKRHGDTRVSAYRDRGTTPERLIGLLAEWCGIGRRRETTAAEFAERFTLDALPRDPVTFTAADDRWLKEGT